MQLKTNYQRVERAIAFILEHQQEQPSLEEIAKAVHLSPFHFQRMFQEWAGVSPKKFLQYVSVQHARELLRKDYSLLAASEELGLSGSSRLHDLFVSIEAMTPGEFSQGGARLRIAYSYANSPFGEMLIASTNRGVCRVDFIENRPVAYQQLKNAWPNAILAEESPDLHDRVERFFNQKIKTTEPIALHLKGTSFQIKVWEALLRIPGGSLVTYSSIASQLGKPSASRAVGSAVGDNPVGFLIPCHRVIRSTGIVGDYRWSPARKVSIIGWEQCQFASATREPLRLSASK